MGTATFDQEAFRARGDTVGLNTNTFTYSQNANFTQLVDATFRVRYRINSTSTNVDSSFGARMRYSLDGGAYTACTTTTAVKLVSSGQFVTNDACSSKLITSAGTFIGTGLGSAGANPNTVSMGGAVDRGYEFEFALQLDSTQMSGVTTVTLRLYNGTGALASYTNAPSITVDTGAVNWTGTPTAGALKIAGQSGTIATGSTLTPTSGALQINGQTATAAGGAGGGSLILPVMTPAMMNLLIR